MLAHKSVQFLAAALGLALPAQGLAQVVGLREAHRDFFVAVRGMVPQGTVVIGIRFLSNDATVFPEVALVADLEDRRLPSEGAVLRTRTSVSGISGYVTVSFDPYEVPSSQYLWAIVRFPVDCALRAVGLGGGPGIGWRPTRELEDERSLFSVEGAMNEFSPAFDISLVTATVEGPLAKPSSQGDEEGKAGGFDIRTAMQTGGRVAKFVVYLPREDKLRLDLYSVAGRHVRRLVDGTCGPGVYEFEWPGTDSDERHVARGIYVYKALMGTEVRSGKVVLK
jgi:hypothetical protein